MYAKGMSVRDIQTHVQELYGAEISPSMISNITDKVHSLVTEWQARPLDSVYSVIFFDAIHYKVREDGVVKTKACYTVLGITTSGMKQILGIWVGEAEGAKYWLGVITELQNRGVKDILIACMDGLKGLPEAILSVFPKTDIQLCVIHMIRNSVKYIPHHSYKPFLEELKTVYRALTEDQARENLAKLEASWGKKYPLAIKPWLSNWDNVKTFFRFPAPIRQLIYTTNAVEAVHRQFRKVTKTRGAFPSDDALKKLLFLAIRDTTKKWTMCHRFWREIVTHLAIAYGDRFEV
jgi:putative transposase